jgi:hypothetical protein
MLRKSVALFAVVLPLALSASAHAQFGVYGMATVDRISGIQGSPLLTPGTTYKNTVDPLGGTFGVFYDFKRVGPITLGADVRGVFSTSRRGAQTSAELSGAKLYSGLGGVRAVFHTPFHYLTPYVQASAGIGRSDYGILSTVITKPDYTTILPSIPLKNNLEYHVYAGVDLKIFPMLDWRVAELGYGGLQAFGTNSHNYPIKSASTGIVFHFPHILP